jgi:hypothetical protein
MSVLSKVRYKLGRLKARGRAYESTLDNGAVRLAVFQEGSSPGLMTSVAAADVIAKDRVPGEQERRELGTEL